MAVPDLVVVGGVQAGNGISGPDTLSDRQRLGNTD